MNITKEQADRVTVLAVRIAVWLPGESETGRALKNDAAEIADIMRGLAEDAEPALLTKFNVTGAVPAVITPTVTFAATSPQAAQSPTNQQALALANEWHGQAGGELAPQLTSNEIAGMLAQFASDPTRDWPQWMRDQARVDTASFPTSPQAAQTDEREAFEAWAKSKHLSTDRTHDAWGRPVYFHSIERMWDGWQARAGRKG